MKRLTAILLAFVLVLACLPAGALASAPGARIEGVDYTRIEENETLQKTVTITVGDRVFTGALTNGETLSQEEVDALIRAVMTSAPDGGITSGMLLGAAQRASEALKYDESRYVQPRVLAELVLANIGVGSAEELSKMLTGEKPFPTSAGFYADMAKDMAVNKLLDTALGAVTSQGFASLIGAVQSVADVASREYLEYIDSEEKIQQAVAAALALEEFYALCNARIRAAEKEKGVNQWSIKCAQTVWTNKTLFGAGVTQYWRLTCDLARTGGSDDPASWGGTYTGSMKLDIWHDMSQFDADFVSRYYLTLSPFASILGVYSVTDRYSQGSILTKTLTNSAFTVVLDPGLADGGSLEKPFSFAGFQDRSFFWTLHPVRAALEIGPFSDGNFHYSGYGATADANLEMLHTFAGELNDGGRGVHLDLYSYDLTDNFSLVGPHVSEHSDTGESGELSMTVATDTQIFSDLGIVPMLEIRGA